MSAARFIQISRISDSMTAATEKQIVSNYQQSLKTLNNQMADIYQKYEVNGKLSYQDMAKYKRLENLYKEVNKEVYSLTGKNATETKTLARNSFSENYYRTGFILESEVQAKLNFTVLNPKTIQASVENPIAGLTLNQTLQKNRAGIISTLKSSITQGLILGDSYGKMANRMKDVLAGDAKKAIRVARTEGHRNANAGRLASYEHAKDLGVEQELMWVSVLDDRTRDQHQSMDGQLAENLGSPKDNAKYWMFTFPDGVTTPGPGQSGVGHHDIQCRCDTRSIIKGYEPKVRRVTGEGVVPYKTYEEWANAKGIPLKYATMPTGYEVPTKFQSMEKVSDMIWGRNTAKDILAKAISREPSISTMVKSLANSNKAKMAGYDFRLKTEDSLARKLRSDFQEKKFTVVRDKVANSMGDTVRYTMLLDEKNYSAGVLRAYDDMIERGFTPYKFKNYWTEPQYKGFNTNWIDSDGQKFEIQFHTQSTFDIKEHLSHPIYEKLRATKDPILLKRYNDELTELWKTAPVPSGVFNEALATKRY